MPEGERMKLQESSLRVFFNTKVEEGFIGEIRDFFEGKGYKWTGQGMDITDDVYDISFKELKGEIR